MPARTGNVRQALSVSFMFSPHDDPKPVGTAPIKRFVPVKRCGQYLPLKQVLPAISGFGMQIWTVAYGIWTMRHECALKPVA